MPVHWPHLLIRRDQKFVEIIRLLFHDPAKLQPFLCIEGSDFLVSADTVGMVTNIFHYVVERRPFYLPLIVISHQVSS